MYRVVTPQTESELDVYYKLRWELLRKPFNFPLVPSETNMTQSPSIA